MSATDKRAEIVDVRAYIPVTGREGGDYHAQQTGHWIVDSLIANPMSVYPAYKERRTSWGIDALGGLIVEIETRSGATGVGISQGGVPGCLHRRAPPEPLPARL
ncbi:MAG: hypothetical protein KatS3mg059_0100 [Thermomicrobiales bacterium]|nr:MAG: hypothetical protein KatS3mg059_0100 [Thermomicrobiales bacterium]